MDESRLKARTEDAVRHFWTVRKRQQEAQGRKTGTKDAGSRSAGTGGAQLNGFITLVGELIAEACGDGQLRTDGNANDEG
jgi:hypothetical protein